MMPVWTLLAFQVRVQAVEGRRDRVTFCEMSFIM